MDKIAEDILPFDSDPTQEITVQYTWDGDFGESEGEQETYTPLQAAVNRQRIPIARALMEKFDVNYLGPGARRRTALQHAVDNGNMELVNLLISEHGARIDSPPATDGGATALQIASLKGYIGIARKLLDLGADVNEDPAEYNGRTALQGAAEHGRIDMLQILLDEGALIAGENEPQYHKTLELAEPNGHYAAARMLRSWRDSVYLNPSAV
jgi:ankyrin repeat protein